MVIFSQHVQACRQCGVNVAGVADIRREVAEAAAAKYEIPFATDDWRRLLERKDIDVVSICAPPQFHRQIAVAALQAGKHVLCEKPLATNLVDADAIVSMAEQSPGRLAVCHQMRLHPPMARLKWLLQAEHLGELLLARCNHFSVPPRVLVQQGLWGSWSLAGGGVLMTKTIHQLDALLWLLGAPSSVSATMGTKLYPIESEDYVAATIRFASGVVASVVTACVPYGPLMGVEIFGAQGMASDAPALCLKVANAEAPLCAELDRLFPIQNKSHSRPSRSLVARLRRKLSRRAITSRPMPPQSPHALLLSEFLQSLAKGQEVPVTAREGRSAVELCLAIYSAALTGQTVSLPLSPSSPYYGGISKDDYAHLSAIAVV